MAPARRSRPGRRRNNKVCSYQALIRLDLDFHMLSCRRLLIAAAFLLGIFFVTYHLVSYPTGIVFTWKQKRIFFRPPGPVLLIHNCTHTTEAALQYHFRGVILFIGLLSVTEFFFWLYYIFSLGLHFSRHLCMYDTLLWNIASCGAAGHICTIVNIDNYWVFVTCSSAGQTIPRNASTRFYFSKKKNATLLYGSITFTFLGLSLVSIYYRYISSTAWWLVVYVYSCVVACSRMTVARDFIYTMILDPGK